MEELNRLVRIVEEYKSKNNLFVNLNDDSNLETQLYNLIKAQKAANDEVAAQALYGISKSPVSYRMLKSRLKKKLIKHIHFLKLPDDKFNVVYLIKRECASLLFEAESLKTVNEFKLAEKVIDQALKLAIDNEVNDYVVMLLEQKKFINNVLLNVKGFKQQSILLEHYYLIEKAEREASHLYLERVLEIQQGVKGRSKLLAIYPTVINRLEELWQESKSSKIFFYAHFIKIQYLELIGSYHLISSKVHEAENLVERGLIHKNWFNVRFNSYINVYSLLQTKQYELGIKQSQKYISYFDAYSLNWFAFMENYFLLALHSNNYFLANSILNTALEGEQTNKLNTFSKERWEIFRRYFLLISKITGAEVDNTTLNYKSVTSLSLTVNDKNGYNLIILILEILESISKSTFEERSQIDRIQNYTSKYLKGPKAERPRIFLKLLLLVIKENYNVKLLDKNSRNLLLKLRKAPIPGDAFAEVEIVPYEHLWELVLQLVKQKDRQ